ncbi:hypothetical protein LJC63_10475, partial [Ruminococcaceae bacterium OttesenSCG-928-L11]|nr:hypothetical protein [Ruminococcaceae bacterium OttesenSCG-928-L11]
RLYSSKKYFGKAEVGFTNDDNEIVDKYYDNLVEIIRLTTTNLSSNKVSFEDYDSLHVYNAKGDYLGTTNNTVAYSDIYYLTDKKINMGGLNEASSSSSEAPAPSTSTGSSTTNTTVIDEDTLVDLTKTAISTAKSSGSKTASVRVKDAAYVSADALKAMASTAKASGMTAQLNADTTSGGTTTGRLTLDPSKTANDIDLGVYVDSSHTSSVQSKFDKWFSNDVVVIALEQQGSYGTTVTVSALVNVSDISTSNMKLYSYDTNSNKYKELTNTGVKTDSNGYLQFKTTDGNYIIVSNGALKRS